jgi:hypothetical protein
MAAGTSPFFATNAGEGLSSLPEDLHASQVDELKSRLELAGLSSKEAEAEATRRVNIANMATKFMDRQDSIAQRREDSWNRSQDRKVQMAQTEAYQNATIAERYAAIQARKDTFRAAGQEHIYGAYTSNMNNLQRLAAKWDEKNSIINPDAVNPYDAQIADLQNRMDSYTERLTGEKIAPPAPAAAKGGRQDPLGIR